MEFLLSIWFAIEIMLGIGFLIFVHELGHFLFAKWHGVRVETFSLGFGPRVWGFKRGETDYTIRAIPLGGYVKMTGENPTEVRTGAADELSSKGVWARFQIFVAGTASNFVWSFPIMICAFLVGKEAAAPIVGDVRPETSEWTSELQTGDEVVSIGGVKVLAYEDYVKEIVRRPRGQVLEVEYRRDGQLRKTTVTVGTARQIGLSPVSTVVADVEKGKAADGAGLKKGDEILSVDGTPVFDAGEIAGMVDRAVDREMSLVVRGKDGQTRTVRVRPGKGEERWTLGLGIEAYPAAVGIVRPGSPADRAGVRPGDVFTSIDGKDIANFQEMTAWVRARPNTALQVTWRHGEELKSATITAGSQGGRGFLGVTPETSSTIATVVPDSPLAKAGVKAGDRVLAVNGKEVRPTASPGPDDVKRVSNEELFTNLGQIEEFARKKGEKLELGIKRGSESITIAVMPEKRADGDLGIKLQHKTVMLRPGFTGSLKRGCAEALDVFLLTFQMLKKLVWAEEEASNLSGPVGIVSASYKSAREGLGNLLWLLGLISVNLAVINLLPIPVLDGGHIMFLLIEKVKGKPVSENVLNGAQWVGIILLLTLVVFVTIHDVRRLFT
ncbi:MAG: RIP metalloprotease RseP [Planctomycetes bacterium]|nr:RIP metalloprotease RseP [Planctomycetota bacterium]